MLSYYPNTWYPLRNYSKKININSNTYIYFKNLEENIDISSILVIDMESKKVPFSTDSKGIYIKLSKLNFTDINILIYFNKLT